MSNTGLIFYLNNTESGEEFFDEIVLFIIESGSAQVGDTKRAMQLRVPGFIASLSYSGRNHAHGNGERDGLPFGSVRPAIEHFMHPM